MARIAPTDTIGQGIIERVRRAGDSHIATIAYNRIRIWVNIACLTIVMSFGTGVDTTDNSRCLRNEEGVVTNLILLAISVVVRIICTSLHIYLKPCVAVQFRTSLTRSNDIIEGITQTVERVKDTRTHLAIHVRHVVGVRVVLQCTSGIRIQQLGVHNEQTTHNVSRVNINREILIQRTRAYLDKVVVLRDERIRSPSITSFRTVTTPTQTTYTGYIC